MMDDDFEAQPVLMEMGHNPNHVFKIDDMARLQRYLILGTDGGTYYASEKVLKAENLDCIQNLILADRGAEIVAMIKNIAEAGRAPKPGPGLSALALVARLASPENGSRDAYEAVQSLCGIPTLLFTFIENCLGLHRTTLEGKEKDVLTRGGWGRAMRRAIAKWYNKQTPMALANAVTKYKSRNGWSHRDVLALCHVVPASDEHNIVYKFIMENVLPTEESKVAAFLRATVDIHKPECLSIEVEEWIREFNLSREHLPSQLLNDRKIWKLLLPHMGITATIRNLNKMTSIGVFEDDEMLKLVLEKMRDPVAIAKGKIHPFQALVSSTTYRAGRGDRGSLTWDPHSSIIQALEQLFYNSFQTVKSTGKRIMLALDVSGSMTSAYILGCKTMTAREASAAMAMVTLRSEPAENVTTMAFSDSFIPLDLNSQMTLEEVIQRVSHLEFSATDCALPMKYALDNKLEIDTFIIYTDSETNCWGHCSPDMVKSPSDILKMYRARMNLPETKLIVVGMTATEISIADPDDPGMLDVVGFDASAPQLMEDFICGRVTSASMSTSTSHRSSPRDEPEIEDQ
jgi:60 kDa SS-A/Ro ribonucleoprotein